MNVHWRPVYKICSTCFFHYNFITKIETFQEDLSYIKKRFKIKEIKTNSLYNAASNSTRNTYYDDQIVKYFNNIDKKLLKRLYEVYKYDFILFDYKLPAFMKFLVEIEN